MARKETIVRYTADELDAMLARGEDQTDWARVDAKTEEELAADMASDRAWDGVPEDWVQHAQFTSGPPVWPQGSKQRVSVNYDTEVVAFFKGQGRGWQGRMNAVLRCYMERSKRT